jgi:hypothetical protein
MDRSANATARCPSGAAGRSNSASTAAKRACCSQLQPVSGQAGMGLAVAVVPGRRGRFGARRAGHRRRASGEDRARDEHHEPGVARTRGGHRRGPYR